VDEPVSAEIKGNASIFLGDSSYLHLSLRGSPPWNVSIDHLGDLNINSSEIKIAINPVKSTEYKISQISNYCGAGISSGLAKVNVLSILGSNSQKEEALKVYPNPMVDEYVTFELLDDYISEIQIIDASGREVFYEKTKRKNTGIINMRSLSSGKYSLILKGPVKTYNYNLIK